MAGALLVTEPREKFRLEPDEQKVVGARLDEKYPARKRTEKKILHPLIGVPEAD